MAFNNQQNLNNLNNPDYLNAYFNKILSEHSMHQTRFDYDVLEEYLKFMGISDIPAKDLFYYEVLPAGPLQPFEYILKPSDYLDAFIKAAQAYSYDGLLKYVKFRGFESWVRAEFNGCDKASISGCIEFPYREEYNPETKCTDPNLNFSFSNMFRFLFLTNAGAPRKYANIDIKANHKSICNFFELFSSSDAKRRWVTAYDTAGNRYHFQIPEFWYVTEVVRIVTPYDPFCQEAVKNINIDHYPFENSYPNYPEVSLNEFTIISGNDFLNRMMEYCYQMLQPLFAAYDNESPILPKLDNQYAFNQYILLLSGEGIEGHYYSVPMSELACKISYGLLTEHYSQQNKNYKYKYQFKSDFIRGGICQISEKKLIIKTP